MKSYTDISQSKKLAKILPHITADNTWEKVTIAGSNLNIPEERQYVHRDTSFSFFSGIGVPCWSLDALLEIIRNNGRYEMQMYEGGYYFEANGFMTESYFNPIDACVEMIIELHEQKLL